MKIESIRLKNFRAFRDVHLRDLPNFCVLVGANGTGKSTLFSVFEFLRNAMSSNLTSALGKLGGSRGFQEVRSRGCEGPIEIELKIRADIGAGKPKLITYELVIDEINGRPVVAHEVMKYRRGSSGKPWHFIDFSQGEGEAVTNELDSVNDESELRRKNKRYGALTFSQSKVWRSSRSFLPPWSSERSSKTGTSRTFTSVERVQNRTPGTRSTSHAKARIFRS